MVRVPAKPLARRHLFRIPVLDKTGVRPARCADTNFSAHTSTKSQRRRKQTRLAISPRVGGKKWLRGLDLNQRPSGYEPDELPGCSTPRLHYADGHGKIKLKDHLRRKRF